MKYPTPTNPMSKPWKCQLQEYCQRVKVPLPIYTTVERGGRWECRVSACEYAETGELGASKVEAESSAARKLYERLIRLGSFSDPDRVREERVREERVREDRRSDPNTVTHRLLDEIRDQREIPRPFQREERPRVERPRERIDELLTVPIGPRPLTPEQRGDREEPERKYPRPIGPSRMTPQEMSAMMARSSNTLRFPNNIFGDDFISHLSMVVQNKQVEVCSNLLEVPTDVPVRVLLTEIPSECILSEFGIVAGGRACVTITIPRAHQEFSFQATTLVHLIMRRNAHSCALRGVAV